MSLFAAGGIGMGALQSRAEEKSASNWNSSGVKITDIKVVLTAPERIRLVVVKVETSRTRPLWVGMRDIHPNAPSL